MKGLVSIITVNYNGWKDTCEMIASLKEYETYPYEVIVVDNASKGDDVERITALCPEVTLVCSERNLGFAGGNNLGYKKAEGEYIFFLNNDTVIKEPVLGVLVQRLEKPGIGGVSPMIRYYDSPNGLQYYGDQKMTRITLRHTTPYDAAHQEKYLVDREIGVMHGAAMMIPRKVIDEVGTMPECYFLYYEEFDLSYRILAQGYRIWYEPAAVIFHKEGTKKGKALTPFREFYLVRGRVLFARRSLKGFDRFLSCCYLLGIVMPRNVLRYLLQRRWKSIGAAISGSFSGLFSRSED
mgnify:CR=1 FL=1|jgi:GT2 family glycosyltransferase